MLKEKVRGSYSLIYHLLKTLLTFSPYAKLPWTIAKSKWWKEFNPMAVKWRSIVAMFLGRN